MDTTNSASSLRRKTPTKRLKPYRRNVNTIKVVYISNPMKIRVTAAEFRALVQELTGQDAESLPDPSRFRDYGSEDSDSVGGVSGGAGGGGGGGGHETDNCEKNNEDDENDRSASDGMVMQQVEAKDCKWEGQIGSSMEWFEAFDDVDVFTTQISAFYESSQADLQVLNAV